MVDVKRKPQALGRGKGKGKEGPVGAGKGLLYAMPPPPPPEERAESPATAHTRKQSPQTPLPTIKLSTRGPSQAAKSSPRNTPPSSRPSAPPGRGFKIPPPRWMTDAMAVLQEKQPYDRFELIHKPRADPNNPNEVIEWRLKCLDCPGKVYKTGPLETLDNFASHLKFKGHRNAVKARLAAEGLLEDDPVQGNAA